MRTAALALVVVAAVAAQGPASPASGQARVRTELDTAVVNVGDRVTMTVSVEHDPTAIVRWPDSLSLAPFEVLSSEAVPAREEAGDRTVTSARRYVLTAFELGELEIPSFEVEVVPSEGETEVVSTAAYGVVVESVGADESDDIRDIRGPLGLGLDVWLLLTLLLGLLLVAGLAYGLVRRLRAKRDEDARPALGALARPAHEVALGALDALERSPLLGRGEVKEYHIRLSDILRSYVEGRFRVDAHEMTTREVLEGLARVGVGTDFRTDLGRFLEACDLVKFAKVRPGPDRARETLELGRRLVHESKPRFEPPTGDGPGSPGGDASKDASPDEEAA